MKNTNQRAVSARKMVSQQQVRAMIRNALLARTEIKRFSQVVAAFNPSAPGVLQVLTQGLIIGDTISGRTGDSIIPRSLEVNYSLIFSPVAVLATPVTTRVIIFSDRLNVGVVPTIAQVLDGGAFNSTYTLQPDQQKRFHILYDKAFITAYGATNQAVLREFRFKLKGKIFYNGDTNVAASNGPGSLYMITIADSNPGAVLNASYYSSLLYTDA